MIITFPGVYHCGFSNSFNLCEAVNLATADWIETGWHFKQMDKREGFLKRTCFSMEWIIYSSFMKRFSLNLKQEARELLEKEFEELVQKVLVDRAHIRKNFDLVDEVLVNGQKIKYFDYTCMTCKNYLYLSWLGCSKCMSLYCVSHRHACECEAPELYLFKRIEDLELQRLLTTQ